jgi:hypothetical protein
LLKDKGSFRRIVQQPTIQKDYKHIKVSKFGYFFGLKDEGSAISFGSQSIKEDYINDLSIHIQTHLLPEG